MAIKLRLSTVTFSDDSVITFESGVTVVVVGPNNSGKSECLRAISEKLTNPTSRNPVVKSIALESDGTAEELEEWLKAHGEVQEARPGHSQYAHMGVTVDLQNARAWWGRRTQGLEGLRGWFCQLLTAEARINAATSPQRIPLTRAAPNHPIHVLDRNDEIEMKISAYFRRAFGVDLIVHRGAGSELPLMVGVRPTWSKEHDRASFAYAQELEKLPVLTKQGDGMRSFAGVLLHTFVGEEPIMLIDEPEAFLHPPQAKLLGRMLVEGKRPDRQMIVATHSIDVLRGLLSARDLSVRVIRIQRNGSINAVRTLDNAKIQEVWNDPLLRYSNILDGIFHQKVVLCEADGDCRFYAAIADAIGPPDREDAHSQDAMYTHCGGKARMPTVIRALRSVDVPVSVVTDFDVLNDENPLQDIISAVGGDWSALVSDWRIVKAAVDGRKAELDSDIIKRDIGQALANVSVSPFPRGAREEIEKILRRSSPWAIAKTVGKSYVPHGEPRAALERFLAAARSLGIFIVEIGELEGFAATIGGHGPAWVNEVLKRDLGADPELDAARAFVRHFS